MNTKVRSRCSLILIVSFIVFVVLSIGDWAIRYHENSIATKQREKELNELKEMLSGPCKGFEKEAVSKAQVFCNKFNIPCGNDFLSKIGYAGLDLADKSQPGLYERYGTVSIKFDKKKARNIPENIYIGVDCQSKDVSLFSNKWQHQDLVEKYGGMVPRDAKWPEPMPEKEAEKIIKGIAVKLNNPDDMIFEYMKNNTHDGVWNGFWIRKKDGFSYEDDWMVISIMAATGEFVGYEKRYKMKPCPTVLNITREEAVARALGLLGKAVSEKVQDKIKDLYEIEATPLIIQPSRFKYPVNEREVVMARTSKLAWVIKFQFTGRLPNSKKTYDEMSKKELEEVYAYVPEMMTKWHELGRPRPQFEVRIDAATGERIYPPEASLSRPKEKTRVDKVLGFFKRCLPPIGILKKLK